MKINEIFASPENIIKTANFLELTSFEDCRFSNSDTSGLDGLSIMNRLIFNQVNETVRELVKYDQFPKLFDGNTSDELDSINDLLNDDFDACINLLIQSNIDNWDVMNTIDTIKQIEIEGYNFTDPYDDNVDYDTTKNMRKLYIEYNDSEYSVIVDVEDEGLYSIVSVVDIDYGDDIDFEEDETVNNEEFWKLVDDAFYDEDWVDDDDEDDEDWVDDEDDFDQPAPSNNQGNLTPKLNPNNLGKVAMEYYKSLDINDDFHNESGFIIDGNGYDFSSSIWNNVSVMSISSNEYDNQIIRFAYSHDLNQLVDSFWYDTTSITEDFALRVIGNIMYNSNLNVNDLYLEYTNQQ